MIPDDRKKSLRNAHRLYKRIGGAVIWGLLEECGIGDDAYASAFLDEHLKEMSYTISVMEELELGEAGYFTFFVHEPGCVWCTSFTDKIISVDDVDWRNCLPPFAVGCRMSCRTLSALEIQALPADEKASRLIMAHDFSLPACSLLCPLVGKETPEHTGETS